MGRKTTYQKIAQRASVSVSSVSRVANGNSSVDRQIRERVNRAAVELGVQLRAKRRNKIFVFVLSNRPRLHPFHSQIFFGAEAALTGHGYSTVFLSFHYPVEKAARELHLPPILENPEHVSGVILAGTNFPNFLDLLSRRTVPFVVLGNNVVGAWEPEKHDVVWFDDRQGAYDLTRYLQSLGHRDIWFVGNCGLTWYARRHDGYRQAMEEAGLLVRLSEVDAEDDVLVGYLSTKSLLNRNEPVTAILGGNGRAGQGACQALREKGLAIPEDVSVATFNDADVAVWHPPLTAVELFPEQISKRMVELLINRVTRAEVPPQQSVTPTQLIKRESCDRRLPFTAPLQQSA
jgi:DNA-binding LacI/PurR family transcriptional regulator